MSRCYIAKLLLFSARVPDMYHYTFRFAFFFLIKTIKQKDMISQPAVDFIFLLLGTPSAHCKANNSKECLNKRPDKVVRQRQTELSEVQPDLHNKFQISQG